MKSAYSLYPNLTLTHLKERNALNVNNFREAAIKSSCLNGPAIKNGGRRGWAIKEKITFSGNLFFQRSKISTAIKVEGGGGLDLNGPAI